MNRLSCVWAAMALASLLVTACDQLGNPKQYGTGPTSWNDEHGHLITQTRSFRNEKTIRQLVSDGFEDFHHADPSIGPTETLTLVFVVPRAIRVRHRGALTLATIFKLPDGPAVVRRWTVPAQARHWRGAFALPAPPLSAVTSVVP